MKWAKTCLKQTTSWIGQLSQLTTWNPLSTTENNYTKPNFTQPEIFEGVLGGFPGEYHLNLQKPNWEQGCQFWLALCCQILVKKLPNWEKKYYRLPSNHIKSYHLDQGNSHGPFFWKSEQFILGIIQQQKLNRNIKLIVRVVSFVGLEP